MNIKRFFFSLNEDCWIDRKIIKYAFIIILIPLILIFLNVIPIKKIINGKYIRSIFFIMVIFGIEIFYILFLDIMPNIFKNIPKIILIMISTILIPISLLVYRDLNVIMGLLMLILNNYIIGYDIIFERNNIFENISVSLIRFVNFLFSIFIIIYLILNIAK